MNILAIETSSPVLSVALKKGRGKISELSVSGFSKHLENLISITDRLLKKEKLSIRKIDTFLIGRGPGSFTGLRIGFATLKGFLALQRKDCYGTLSLDAIADSIELPNHSWLAVCLDARREKIYTRFYQRRENSWIPKNKATVLSVDGLVKNFPGEIWIAGDALARYRTDFEKYSQKAKIHFLPEKSWYPKASALISKFEMQRLGRGEVTSPLQLLKKSSDFLPLYFRLPEAEENRKQYASANIC